MPWRWIGWPATRNLLPRQIVWRQDDVLHSDFYWLSLPDGQAKAREEMGQGGGTTH